MSGMIVAMRERGSPEQRRKQSMLAEPRRAPVYDRRSVAVHASFTAHIRENVHVHVAVSGCSHLSAHAARESLGQRALGARRRRARKRRPSPVAARRARRRRFRRALALRRADRSSCIRSEAEGYHLNITSPEPKVFVMWRMADAGVAPAASPVVVTVSYNQAARMLDGGEQVDARADAARTCWHGWSRSSPSTTSPRRAARCGATIRSATTPKGGRADRSAECDPHPRYRS